MLIFHIVQEFQPGNYYTSSLFPMNSFLEVVPFYFFSYHVSTLCLYSLHCVEVSSRFDSCATEHRNRPRAPCRRATGASLLSGGGPDSHFCLAMDSVYKSWWDRNHEWAILHGARVMQMHVHYMSTCVCVRELCSRSRNNNTSTPHGTVLVSAVSTVSFFSSRHPPPPLQILLTINKKLNYQLKPLFNLFKFIKR